LKKPNRNAQEKFLKSRKAELDYARKLRSVAKQIDHIVRGMAPNGVVDNIDQLVRSLRQYSETIGPWARSVAARMLQEIARRDADMWKQMSNEMGRDLQFMIENAPIGHAMAVALNEQVTLIKSLPLEAAQRVHDLTILGLSDSTRAKDIANEIMSSGQVARSRATLIARTEVGRTATELTKTRAEAAGITHYIWRTSGDSDVRLSHKKMNGQVVAFNKMPTLSDGTTCHAGAIYNCRCYPEPIIPEDYE